MLRVTAKAATNAEAAAMLEPVVTEIRAILGDEIYGQDVDSLEQVVIRDLTAAGLTLAAAESCTGGLISKRLTDIPGASSAFLGGVVAYSNAVKINLLGVDVALIASQGAVCAQAAEQMAKGVRRLTGADIGLGVTGIAGPDGGSAEKPVGLVYVALDFCGEAEIVKLNAGTDRGRVRTQSSNRALDMVRRKLGHLPCRDA